MKTNQPGKQNPLFLYVDKIIFGVLVLAGLYYCYSAVSLPQITWTPQQLTDDSTAASNTIENSTFLQDLKIDKYDERARNIRAGFRHTYYETPQKWEPPVFPEKILRKVPTIYSVIKLRAVSGVGAVRVRESDSIFGNSSPTGGMASTDMGPFGDTSGMGTGMTSGSVQTSGKVEATNWVLLTGLIPYEDQILEYVAKFANAMYSSSNDFPTYLYIDIERNEIGAKNPNGTPLWVALEVDNEFVMQNETWAGRGLDPVDFQYTLPPPGEEFNPTASPLPPLANRDFGQEVAYPPYIPLMSETLKTQMVEQQKIINQMLQNWRPRTRRDTLDDENTNFGFFQGAMGGTGGSYGGGMGGTGGTGGTSSISPMYSPGSGMGSTGRTGVTGGEYGSTVMGGPGGMGSDYSGTGMGTPGDMGGSYGTMGGGARSNPWRYFTDVPPTVMVEAKYRLFRYFDFTVEPGKSYQYRVKLGVYNPNYRLTDKYLDPENVSTKKDKLLWSEFSYPSGPAAVNSNARVLAKSVGNIPPANRNWQSQSATVSSIVFDKSDNEDYIAKDLAVTQGMVLNFSRRNSEKVSELRSTGAMSGSTSDMMGGGMSPTSSSSGRGTTQTLAKTTTKSLDHISDECLLDVAGKRKLIGTNNEHTPQGQVLFMAFDGTIQIQSIKSNKLELDRYEKPVTASMSGSMPY